MKTCKSNVLPEVATVDTGAGPAGMPALWPSFIDDVEAESIKHNIAKLESKAWCS